MGENRKERLIFTMIMCAFMVYTMSVYNIILYRGSFSFEVIRDAAFGFIPAFLCGIICDWFIVARPAKAVAFRFLKPEDLPIKKILTISFFMVSGMVLCMSMYGAIRNVGVNKHLPMAYLSGIPKNFIVALPLQILIGGPLGRFFFRRIIPLKNQNA
jgi:hypothetical protein